MSRPECILILDGHPNDDSFCRNLGEAYERGATASGAEVRRSILAHLTFNPNLNFGYQRRMELEPDLVKAQQDIAWANHIVVIHPVWWSNLPALLKAFIDRVFLPGFAFRYREGSVLWDKLLRGKTGRIIYTLDTPGWYYRLILGRPALMALKKGTLEFCGVTPVRATAIGPIKQSTAEVRARWLQRVEKLGRNRA